jgi:P4 family phage/plasmid primase-like protien
MTADKKYICMVCVYTGKYKFEKLENPIDNKKCCVCGKADGLLFHIFLGNLVDDFLILNSKGQFTGLDLELIVENILNHFNLATLYSTTGEIIYCKDDFIWKPDGREKIENYVEIILGSYCKNNLVNEIVKKIKRKTTISKENFYKEFENLIVLKNQGIFDLKQRKFIQDDRQYFFKTFLDIKYDREADCPRIKKFLSECLYSEDIFIAQELFGFCLYKRYFIKKAFILFGATDTGKTVFLNLLTVFLGVQNIHGLSLQKICGSDKFALFFLKDKFVNIFDDLSSRDLQDAGGFKIATGGGFITAEQKFGDSITFLTFAKLIFACNTIPSLKDIDDSAYYNRCIPLPFDNPVINKDENLLKKLTTEEELSGLFNFALEGLNRLLENGKFSFDKCIDEIKTLMTRQGNPLAVFCQDVLQESQGSKITRDQMFKIYSLYAYDKKITPLSKSQLGRQLQHHTPYIADKRGRHRFWENVKIISWDDENIKLNEILDTLDTLFSTNVREENSINNYLLIDSKNPSKTSKSLEAQNEN